MRTSTNMVDIDPKKVKNFLRKNGITAVEASLKIGMCSTFISNVVHRGKIHKSNLMALCNTYGTTESTFTPDPIAPPQSAPQAGYSMALEVKPDKVRVAVLFNGIEIHSAFYRVTDNTETGLLRAISCATHICYEMAQQDELKGE